MHTTPTYVVACSAAKLDHAAPAAELYTGAMFQHSYAAACAMVAQDGGRVLILSAKHGLVDPTDVLAPYEQRMDEPGHIDTCGLAATAARFGISWDAAEVYAMVPAAYLRVLDEALRMLDVFVADVYEGSGPGIGYQRRVNRIVATT